MELKKNDIAMSCPGLWRNPLNANLCHQHSRGSLVPGSTVYRHPSFGMKFRLMAYRDRGASGDGANEQLRYESKGPAKGFPSLVIVITTSTQVVTKAPKSSVGGAIAHVHEHQ